jgi:hypothetical protein
MAEKAQGCRSGKKGRVLENHLSKGQIRHGLVKLFHAEQVGGRDFPSGKGDFLGNFQLRFGNHERWLAGAIRGKGDYPRAFEHAPMFNPTKAGDVKNRRYGESDCKMPDGTRRPVSRNPGNKEPFLSAAHNHNLNLLNLRGLRLGLRLRI